MVAIRVSKVTVNIGVGESGERLEKATKLLEKLTNQKPLLTNSKRRIPNWGIRKRQPIGVKVTLRGDKAIHFLEMALDAKDRVLNEENFDDNGNFSFGIHEYIDLPGIKYDPDIGLFGFDVCVTMEKIGYRIARRKREAKKIPIRHRLKKEESIEWAKKNLRVKMGD